MTLVSVITPTWQRHHLLMTRCVPSVWSQTWPDIEHVIVSDGPDPRLAEQLTGMNRVVFGQLPDHRDGPIDYGSRARNHALTLATGEIIAYLDDDNAYRSDHITTMVQALRQAPGADFAYSQMLTHPRGAVIGSPSPCYGGMDTSLLVHWAGVPQRYGMWPLPEQITGDGHAPDWGVVAAWLRAGARWTHLPRVTVDYYAGG